MAYATVPNTSFADPLGDLLQNLPPTVRLFIEAAKKNCRVVFISSGGTVYGPPQTLPITEDHPTAPISPYGLTKLTLEKYAFLYATTHGLKVTCVRPANAYGVGQRPFSGQGFVATAMASAMLGQTIKVFGSGEIIRDYIYVSDIAAGIFSALEHGQIGATYNVGSGIGVSNGEMVKLIGPLLQEVGFACHVEYMPERAFDVSRNVLDSSRLTASTGWVPKVQLPEGLICTREWLMKNMNEWSSGGSTGNDGEASR
jgi:UDP-glucose 4-epimerase